MPLLPKHLHFCDNLWGQTDPHGKFKRVMSELANTVTENLAEEKEDVEEMAEGEEEGEEEADDEEGTAGDDAEKEEAVEAAEAPPHQQRSDQGRPRQHRPGHPRFNRS